MNEVVLSWDKTITPQETGWSCGPASAQIVLNAKGIRVPEMDLAKQVGAHTGGTDHIGLIVDGAFRRHAPAAGFAAVQVPNDPPSQAQRDALWEHITRSIGAGWGLVVNWWSPVNNRPQPVKGAARLQYPASGMVMHYVTYMGFDSTPGRRAVFVADPGFRPFETWLAFDDQGHGNQAATLIPPKGYAYASSAPAGPISPPPAPPAADLVDTLIAAMNPTTVSRARFTELLPAFSAALRQANCDNLNRVAMFCAQTGHESGGMRHLTELWGPTAQQLTYEGRRELGNTQPGDGHRFRGRGIIQLTGRAHATNLSKWAFERGYVNSPEFFVNDPDQMASDKFFALSAVWYWTVARPNLNALSDARDILGATRAINGGTFGLQDRTERFNRCLAMGERLLELTKGAPTVTIPGDGQFESRSPFRHVGEGAIHTLADFIRNTDAMVHAMYTVQKAYAGDPAALALLAQVAAATGDRANDAALAQRFLDQIRAGGADVSIPAPPPFQCLINNGTVCAQGGEAYCSITDSPVCVVTKALQSTS